MLQSRPFLRGSRCAGGAMAGGSPRAQRFILQGIDPIGGRFRTLAEKSTAPGGRAVEAGAGQPSEIFRNPSALACGQNSGTDRPMAGALGNQWFYRPAALAGVRAPAG